MSWNEGRLLDLWTLVHIVAGVTGGFSNLFFRLTDRTVLLIGFGLMVGWELLEYANGVREKMENRIVDVALGVVGVMAALSIAPRLGERAEQVAFSASGLLLALGCLQGWRAYRKRVRAEANKAT